MKRLRPQGFTIVEIAIVIAIVGLLVSLTIVTYTLVQRQARDDERRADVAVLKKALEHYYYDNNEYPAPGGLADYAYDASGLASSLTPRYLQSIPKVPQGANYEYAFKPDRSAYAVKVTYETLAPCIQNVRNYIPSGWSSLGACGEQI